MSTSVHNQLGTVVAIQYTGSNTVEIRNALGVGWVVYSNPNTGTIAPCQAGNEVLGINGRLMQPTDWLVSQPAFGANTPSLNDGGSVMTNTQFVQQYSA